MNKKEMPIFPISGWDIGPVPQKGLVLFRPHFLSTSFQKPEEQQIGRYYALTADQAKELSEKFAEAVKVLENRSGEEGSLEQKH